MCVARKVMKVGIVVGLAGIVFLSACGRHVDEEIASSAASAGATKPSPTHVVTSDDEISKKIDAVFVAEFRRFDITIEVEKSEVTLGGFALNKKQADRALEIAGATQGVSKVTDNISLYPLGYILQ